MSITVDTINLRFNVKSDYNQQQLQKLAHNLTGISNDELKRIRGILERTKQELL